MHLTILGKRYRYREVAARELPPDTRGECSPPNAFNKEIRVLKKQSEFDVLDTAVHEILHAADWSKDEEWVEQFATDLARALWRLNYRRVENRDGK